MSPNNYARGSMLMGNIPSPAACSDYTCMIARSMTPLASFSRQSFPALISDVSIHTSCLRFPSASFER